jgi:HSP20 family protein
MTKNSRWMASVPTSVVTKELNYNRDNLLSSFDKILDDVFRGFNPEIYNSFGIDPFSKSSFPKTNVVAYEDRVTLEAEVAGYSKEDIEVQVEDNTLSIVGTTSTRNNAKTESTTGTYLLRELKRGSFSRSFKLGPELDADRVEAAFNDGILTINIPRKAPVVNKVNKVTIK